MTNIIDKAAHQGDVYVKVAELPTDVVEQSPEDGKTILALGEVTGHHHRFEAENVRMYHANDNSKRRFIVIENEPATLFHEEHAPITFAPGVYEVFIAREWTDDEEPVRVAD